MRHRQGRLIGRLEGLGFELQAQATAFALAADALGTAAIEGERLDPAEVRSSVARRLGLPAGDAGKVAGRAVDGLVSVLVDATQAASRPLTTDRLQGWHAALFPTGFSGMRRVTVGAWRGKSLVRQ